MTRRDFLTSTAAAAIATSTLNQVAAADTSPANETPESKENVEILAGRPVVSGPSPESLTILQTLAGRATGFVEYSVGGKPFERVDAESAGMMPLEQHVLKFRLPPLPPGKEIRYRVTVRAINWKQVREFIHGEIVAGKPEVGAEYTFRTLDPNAKETRFVVWNDTHENQETLETLEKMTTAVRPDFLLWNGDQTNDVHFEKDMGKQFLTPGGVELASRWPLAYVRGNHDTRGPEARKLPDFTGTPEDGCYHYAFRSGPLAALVMDTGEDKPDDSPYYGGLAAFNRLKARQTKWLEKTVREPWFRKAPFRVLFCHIPLWWNLRHKDPTAFYVDYNKICRDSWSPLLVAAGVKLVISGHTHDYAWLPANDKRPVGQLIGGGPRPSIATFIEGTATRERLTLTMKKLDGTVTHTVDLKA